MIARETVFYPSDDEDSFFSSSDTILNQVWDLCKYSIKATSFTGMFIDGDRERIPYEADAYISQLGQYCVTSEYSLARNSHEYLLYHPTWPTEWIMQSVLMAWNDYFFTGNKESLDHFYIDLKAKSLLSLADETGLISTRKGKVTSDLLNSIHLNKKLNDIIDWPQTSDLEKFKTGETDGFVFQDINTVVNAFHYRALTLMSNIAGVVGEKTDERLFLLNAGKLKKEFNKRFLDKK
jgi:hypothetical protein